MKNNRAFKIVLCGILLIVFTFSLVACNRESTKHFFSFGTSIDVTLNGKNTKSTISSIVKQYNSLDGLFDAENTKSDIYKINCAKSGEVISIMPDTYFLLDLSKKMYKETDGAFNIATYNLSKLWRFTSNTYVDLVDGYTPPKQAEIDNALMHTNLDNLVLLENNQVKKTDSDLLIGLGAIAKGYAGDIAKKNHIKDGQTGILNVGGTIFTIGNKSYNIGIGNPRDSSFSYFGKVTVNGNAVVCTSGDYYRYYESDGKRYCHILGKDGHPASKDNIISVTVVSENDSLSGAMCDVLSTSVFVLGREKGLELAKKHNAQLVLIYNNSTYELLNCRDNLFTLKDTNYKNV